MTRVSLCPDCQKMDRDLIGTENEGYPHTFAECACECHADQDEEEEESA